MAYGHCLSCGKDAADYWGSNARIGRYIAAHGCCPQCNREQREENAVYERDEAKALVAETGSREEAIAQSLSTVGEARTKDRFGWIPDDILQEYDARVVKVG